VPLAWKLERCPIGGGDGKAGIGNGSFDIEVVVGRKRAEGMARRPETTTSLMAMMTTGGIRGAKGTSWR